MLYDYQQLFNEYVKLQQYVYVWVFLMLKEFRLSILGNLVDFDKLRDELIQKLDVIREFQRELVRKDSRFQVEKVKIKQLIEERSDE